MTKFAKIPLVKKLIITLFCALSVLCGGQAFAAKLDLMADVQTKVVSYTNPDFASDTTDGVYFLQNVRLGFVLKDIHPSGTTANATDVGIVLRSLGVAGSTITLHHPFSDAASHYPSSDMTPYVEQAYVKISNMLDRDMTLVAGRQDFRLASGLTLSDDGAGFTGFRFKQGSLYKDLAVTGFVFQPKSMDSESGDVNILGLSFEVPSDGLWQAYSFFELDKRGETINLRQSDKAVRNFTGLSYIMRYGNLSFSGEGAIEKGTAYAANSADSNVAYDGSALILTGKWDQPLWALGTGSAHLSYGRASGDKDSSSDTSEAFFPSFGHRYNGIERSGFGEFFGASLYDAMGGSTSTITGMPDGVSGMRMVNLGITLPAFAGIYTDFDYFIFEADTSTLGSKQIGRELDVKFSYPIRDQIRMTAVGAFFSPGGVYADNTPSANKFSFELVGRF